MKITICGSMHFMTDMQRIEQALISLGHDVRIPDEELGLPELQSSVIRDHFVKINWCDAILVVNLDKNGVPGYIGGSVLMEMGVAFYLFRKIFVLNDVPSQLTYKREIMCMQPIILHGDLTRFIEEHAEESC